MDLQQARELINVVDGQMKELFLRRMEIVREVALYKKEHQLPVYDSRREKEMKERLTGDLSGSLKEDYLFFLEALLTVSKRAQERE